MTEKRKWPDQWNVSVGIPIFKKGNRQDHSNYRIISLGNVMSKIFCKVIDSKLGKWLEVKELLSPFQVGLRKNHSVVDHIFTLRIMVEKYRKGKGGGYLQLFYTWKEHMIIWIGTC